MKKVKLGEVFDLQMGKTPARNEIAYWGGCNKWVSIADLSKTNKYIEETKEFITDKAIKESGIKSVPANTVIMSFKLSIGKTAITKEEIYTNEAIMAFIDKKQYFLNVDYLYHLFSSMDWSEGSNKAVLGLTLNKATLSQKYICIPSLEEQKEIADRLDKVSSLIEKRKTQLEKLDELIKSRFIEMFGDPVKNDKNWETDKLQNVISINKYKGKVDSINNKVWLLNLDMIESNTGNILEYVYENEEDVPNSTIKFNNNSVLYSKLRPYLNKVVMPTKCGYATSELISMNPNSLINKYFLAGLLRYESFVNFANGTAYGAKMPRASVDEIKKFRLILPPIELQNQFATFVEQTDKTKLAIQKSIDKLETLKKSLMQQYFG